MATISTRDADAALDASPVQRLLSTRDVSGGAPPVAERMLQELCTLEGSDSRQRQRQRYHRHLATRGRALLTPRQDT